MLRYKYVIRSMGRMHTCIHSTLVIEPCHIKPVHNNDMMDGLSIITSDWLFGAWLHPTRLDQWRNREDQLLWQSPDYFFCKYIPIICSCNSAVIMCSDSAECVQGCRLYRNVIRIVRWKLYSKCLNVVEVKNKIIAPRSVTVVIPWHIEHL